MFAAASVVKLGIMLTVIVYEAGTAQRATRSACAATISSVAHRRWNAQPGARIRCDLVDAMINHSDNSAANAGHGLRFRGDQRRDGRCGSPDTRVARHSPTSRRPGARHERLPRDIGTLLLAISGAHAKNRDGRDPGIVPR